MMFFCILTIFLGGIVATSSIYRLVHSRHPHTRAPRS